MINSFENYLKMGKAKRQTPDPEEASALLQQAEERLEYTQGKALNAKTAKFVLEDAYEVMRESAQSLMSLGGFKPYSHEATISFLKKFYGSTFPEEDIRAFDRFRQLRNDSVYRAAPVHEEDAKDCLVFATLFVQKIKAKKQTI